MSKHHERTRDQYVPGRLDVTVVRSPSRDQPIVLTPRLGVHGVSGIATVIPALPLPLSTAAAVELTAQLAMVLVDLDVESAQLVHNRLASAIGGVPQGTPDTAGHRPGVRVVRKASGLCRSIVSLTAASAGRGSRLTSAATWPRPWAYPGPKPAAMAVCGLRHRVRSLRSAARTLARAAVPRGPVGASAQTGLPRGEQPQSRI